MFLDTLAEDWLGVYVFLSLFILHSSLLAQGSGTINGDGVLTEHKG